MEKTISNIFLIFLIILLSGVSELQSSRGHSGLLKGLCLDKNAKCASNICESNAHVMSCFEKKCGAFSRWNDEGISDLKRNIGVLGMLNLCLEEETISCLKTLVSADNVILKDLHNGLQAENKGNVSCGYKELNNCVNGFCDDPSVPADKCLQQRCSMKPTTSKLFIRSYQYDMALKMEVQCVLKPERSLLHCREKFIDDNAEVILASYEQYSMLLGN